MPSSNDSLVITIKPKAKHTLHAAAILFLYILQTILHRSYYFPIICYHTPFPDPGLNVTSVTQTSQVYAPPMLLLLTVRKEIRLRWQIMA
jgi:hypothetical protein